MDELNLQRRIVNAFRDQGGWGYKWKTEFSKGVPDLILLPPPDLLGVSIRPRQTFFAEVKYERVAKFQRLTLAVTDMQSKVMGDIHKKNGVVVLLAGIETPQGGRLYVLPHHQKEISSDETAPSIPWNPRNIRFDAEMITRGVFGDA